MSATALTTLIARCRALCRPRLQIHDAELLRRFVQQRDTIAFEELLERYAPLVWSVCRRMLVNEADCEDAFQATFLALVRKPDSIDPSQELGGWLHTVAVRVARKAQVQARRQRPQAVFPERATASDTADEAGNREIFHLVDEEMERLPALLRQPLLLCCLQGRTRDEAAEALGCSVAAVKSRLERGRHLLRRRLVRRGVQLPAAFLALGLTSERIRAALWAKTLLSVRYTPAPAVAALAEAALPGLMAGKGKLALVLLLLATGMGGVFGSVLTSMSPSAPAVSPQAKAAAEPKKPESPRVRTDRHGDPLPEGAIARLGTVRWRHGFFVHDIAYSPDGKKVAAVGAGRAITLWDVASGKEMYQFPNRNQPKAVAFSPDGKMLGTTDTPICRLWDVATGKELRQLKGHTNGLGGVAFAPDSKNLATASSDGTARIWEASTGKQLRQLDGKQGDLYTVAYSPDGKLLATAGKDGTICLWDAATAKERRRLIGPKKEIFKILFSPDGKQVASASYDETIRLWDAATGGQSRILGEKPGEYLRAIAFAPDGKLLASGQGYGTIRLWDMQTGEERRRWQAGVMIVTAIAFSPDGKTLATGTAWDGGIRLWDVATGKELHPSVEHHGFVDFLRFSPDGKTLISLGRDNCMLRWDLAANAPHQLFSWTTKRYGSPALSPDGNTLAVNGWPDSHLRMWNVRTGKVGLALGKPQKDLGWRAIAISPDGRLVASEGDDHMIHVWDVRDGKEDRQIKGFANQVSRLRFSPDNKRLACAVEISGNVPRERTLRLWDMASGTERCSFDSYASLDSLAFSPDGKVLATGDARYRDDSLVRLWDTASGRELCRHTGHRDNICAVDFSPDGKLVASGTGSTGVRDNSVHVWEAATGRLIRRFEGHHSCVGSVAFSPDGLTVTSGAGDSTILLWDITGRRVDGHWHVKPLTPRQLDASWTALANKDAAKAYDAVWALVAAPEQALPLLRKHLSPVKQPDAKMVARLIADLDSDEFRVRDKATKDLSKLGDAAAPALRQALEGKPSLELRRRLQQLLDQSRDWTPERLRVHRAIQALEHIGTRQAKEVLQALAAGAPGVYRTDAAEAAFRRMSR